MTTTKHCYSVILGCKASILTIKGKGLPMKKALAFTFIIGLLLGSLLGSLILISFGGTGGCGGTTSQTGSSTGSSSDYTGTWAYVELLTSKAPTKSLCPCGVPGSPGTDSTDPNNCGPREYTSPAVVDSSGHVTIFGNNTWGTINSSGQWSGSPKETGYINGAVSGTCTSSTSCSGTFKADYVTDTGGAAACYEGTFTMTKN